MNFVRLAGVAAAIAMLRRLSMKAANHMIGVWSEVRNLIVLMTFQKGQIRMIDMVLDLLPPISVYRTGQIMPRLLVPDLLRLGDRGWRLLSHIEHLIRHSGRRQEQVEVKVK